MAGMFGITDAGEIRTPEAENYKEIKPESPMNPNEARSFMDSLFDSEMFLNYLSESKEGQADAVEQQNPHKEVKDGTTYYYDDNGKLYRVGNELKPNSEYEINGYKYMTDEKGRIISAEGKLHLKDHDGRLPIRDSIENIGKGDEQAGDDRGHLIGDQFDGSNGLENMVPQDADINRNDFKNLENELAKQVKEGKDVHVKVEPIYDGDSRRPSAIVVTYTIDGKEDIRVFPNGKER